jgi:hypothetical protein
MGNRKIIAALGLAVCLMALVAAGCGGGGGSPGVANLGGSTDTSTNSSPGDGGSFNSSGGPPSGSGGSYGLVMRLPGQSGVKFAACMRKHGVPNFPDPNSQGGIQISPSSGSGLDPNSPTFQAAQKACGSKLGPGGGPVTASG